MAVKTYTIHIDKIVTSDRFEPRYHALFDRLEEYEHKSKYKVLLLGDKKLLKKITDGEHTGQVFVDNGVRFIKNSAVRDFNINLYDGFFISELKHTQLKRSALKKHDVLFTTVGHLGSTCIVPENFGEANINQNVVKMEINEKIIDPYFLTAYLNSNITKRQIAALFTGNIHSIITYPKIKSIRILKPSNQFQNKIKNMYKQAIDLEYVAQKKLEEVKSIFYDSLSVDFRSIRKEKTFSVQLSSFRSYDLWTPAFSYPYFINTLKAIQNKWKTIPLGEIATVKKGDEVGSINYNEYLDRNDSDVPFIRTSDLLNYEIDQFPDFFIPEEIYKELNQENKPGDVLYTKDGKIGISAMITKSDKSIIASGLIKLRLKSTAKKYNFTPEYLFTILSLKETGLYPSLRRTVTASTIPHLREEKIKDFEIPILDKKSIDEITFLVKEVFELKDCRKKLIKEIRREIDLKFTI